MAKTNSVALLVNSLTKGEKRYFKMYTALQDGDKDYICLFNILEKGNTGDAAKALFADERPLASFVATGKYLYKVITDCLLHIRIDRNKTARLLTALLKVNILFEKSLYDQGFRQLKSIQESAELHEQHFIQLWAAKLELSNLHNLNFNDISEKELINKQLKIQEVLKQEKIIREHSALYELLRHRVLFKGSVRTRKQKDELNDLLMSEMSLTRNPLAETFESSKIHLLFQAQYFITVNDYGSALKIFYELNELFEENEYIWIDSPHHYLSSIEGILDSLNIIKKYKEMDFFLNKLKQLQKLNQSLDVRIQSIVFVYKTVALLEIGAFDKANTFRNTFETHLFTKIHLLDMSKQAEVYMYSALIYIGQGDMNKAHFYLNEILLAGNLYNNLPVFRTFRLLHLLVHYELENHDYIESEVRSIRRGLIGTPSKSYLLEKIVFGFVQRSLPVNLSDRKELWGKISKKFELIKKEKFEIQILKIFDFALWIQSRLYKQSFASLIRQRVSTQQA